MVLYGAHLSRRTILEGVKATGAEVAQIFLGSPRTWAAPAKLSDAELEFWASYKIPMYVHSSYLVNPASSTEHVRVSTEKSLTSQFAAAADIKAKGVIVHGGHASGSTLKEAAARWSKTLANVDMHGVQLLVENTAGGAVAPGRSLEGLEMLWEAISDHSPKLCLDTCHAWTSNLLTPDSLAEDAFMELMDKLDERGIEIGLTHLNGSLDSRNSGRDHHSNLSNSVYTLETAKRVAERAGAPAILETPGPLVILRKELEALREPSN